MLFKRIKRLWNLSSIDNLDIIEPTGFKWTGTVKPQNQSEKYQMRKIYPIGPKIIKKSNPIDDFIHE